VPVRLAVPPPPRLAPPREDLLVIASRQVPPVP
jgi:hypothetical protein